MILGLDFSGLVTKDTILIMPAVSVGNVGQLAVDLLITNLNLDYMGRVNGHDCVYPVVGSDPFDTGHLCTSFMAYRSQDMKLLVFQQRSDFLREKKKEYLQRLLSWLKQCQFRAIFVLTSAFAHERNDAQMAMNPLQYRATQAADGHLLNTSDGCGACRMPWDIGGKDDTGTGTSASEKDGKDDSDKRILPGSGITQALSENCVTANLPLIVISKYCMEGDNKMDSVQVAAACAALLGLPNVPKKWTIPKSWRSEDDPL